MKKLLEILKGEIEKILTKRHPVEVEDIKIDDCEVWMIDPIDLYKKFIWAGPWKK